MKLLIELPSWLGDSVMTTPAIENIVKNFSEIEITVVGRSVALDIYKSNPNINKLYQLEKNYISLFKAFKNLGHFDIFISFRNSFRSKIFKALISANEKYKYDESNYKNRHQVEKYNDFINESLNIETKASNLNIHSEVNNLDTSSKTVGINPGASYGSAKRWYTKEFANVAINLANKFDIVIFGSKNETKFANKIEKLILNKGITNFRNLAGQTSITELINEISKLDLFITGDSGPMHIAASLQIPTISIFGPTDPSETSQWNNSQNVIIRKKLACQPCMKKTCPLIHHNCMKTIKSNDIIDAIPKKMFLVK